MELNNLNKATSFSRGKKRVGRGSGSGKGFHTTGTGTKGQKSRTGHSHKFGFEGGQTPFYKKLPQIVGFTNPRSKEISNVPVEYFNNFEDNSTVTPENLLGMKFKSLPKYGVKILGNGELTKKITFKNFLYSATAKEKIEKAGGAVK